MIQKMLVIGGSLDGQWKEWDDGEETMLVPLLLPTELTAIFTSPKGKLPKLEEMVETYYVRSINLGDRYFWCLSLEGSPFLGPGMIILALAAGYRKPNPCPECHKEPAACPYCGYGEATA